MPEPVVPLQGPLIFGNMIRQQMSGHRWHRIRVQADMAWLASPSDIKDTSDWDGVVQVAGEISTEISGNIIRLQIPGPEWRILVEAHDTVLFHS